MPRRNSKITKSLRRNTNPTATAPQMKITLFPPTVTKDDFLGRSSTNLDTKSPNAFFVYRKAFVKHLSDRNLKFRMTEVSKLVSYNWKNESKEVKAAYTRIAQEIDKEFQERKRIIRGYKIVCDPIMTLDPDFLEPKEDEKQENKSPEITAINNSQTSSSTASPNVKREELVDCHSPKSIATPQSSTTESTIFDSDSGSEHVEQDFSLFEDMHNEIIYNAEPFSPCLEQYEYQPNLEQFVQSDMNCMCYIPTEGQTVDQIWVDESSSCNYTTCLNNFDLLNTFSIEQDPSLCQVENYGEYTTWNRGIFY